MSKEKLALTEDEARIQLMSMMEFPVVVRQLGENGRWVSRPGFARSLDIAFVPTGQGGEELLGVPLFGLENCVGVKLVEPKKHAAVLASLSDRKVAGYLEQGAQVAMLTAAELGSWAGFYEQLETSGILDRVGDKAMNFSGLERARPEHNRRLQDSLVELLARKAEALAELGVAQSNLEYMGLDMALLAEDGESFPLPLLWHLRTGKLEGEILVETVLDAPRNVPGFVVRQAWENKREAYERANQLTAYFQRLLPKYNILVPVISDGQISLLTKLGLTGPLKSSAPQATVEVEDVIRFLYLGKSNVDPGELARLGYSLPGGGGEFGKIDVLFTHKDQHGTRRDTVINNLIGEDLSLLKHGRTSGLIPVANVAGLVVIPDGWSVEQMKAYAQSQLFYLNYHHYGPKVHLLYLTSRLFETWKRRSSVFATPQELESFLGQGQAPSADNKPEHRVYQPIQRLLEYGYGAGQSVQMSLNIYRPHAEIGGMKMILAEEGTNAVVYHVLDWGTSFEVVPEDMQGLANQPGTADGLRSQFETGQLPMVPGLYYRDYILATAKNFSALMYHSDRPVVSFIRAELVKRIDQIEAAAYLGDEAARQIYELGAKDVERWYAGRDRQVAEVICTHAHVDHCGDMPYVDGPLFGRTETIAHLQAMSAKARNWRGQFDSWSKIAQNKEGSAYIREYRNLGAIHWGHQRVRSSINVSFEQHLVDHSLTGTGMTALFGPEGLGVLYTADVRLGSLTQKAVQELSGRFDKIIMETTNFETEKVSAGLTEDMARQSLARIFKNQPKDTMIVVAPPNHLERLNSIMEAAGSHGRRVAVGYSHAQVINQMRIARQQSPLDVEGFNLLLPEIGEDVALWLKPQLNPQTYQKVLSERAEAKRLGLVDQERLSREGKNWVVVVTPYDLLRYLFGGVYFGGGLSVIHSAPFPYARHAKAKLGDNQKWIREQGGRYFKDFEIFGAGGRVQPARHPLHLHVSGHATFTQMAKEVIGPLLNGVYKGKQLILVHGQNPQGYAQALRRLFGDPTGLEITASLDRYMATDPFNYPGFRLDLG